MNRNDYRPRRAERKKHRHPIRAVIIVLFVLAALAFGVPRLRQDPARRDAQQVDAARLILPNTRAECQVQQQERAAADAEAAQNAGQQTDSGRPHRAHSSRTARTPP